MAAWDLCTLINGLIMQINQPPPFAFFVLAPAVVILFLASLRGVLLGAYASAAVIGGDRARRTRPTPSPASR